MAARRDLPVVYRVQVDDVTGHEAPDRDPAHLPGPNDVRLGRHHLLEGLHRPLRLVLLDEAEEGYEEDYPKDHVGVGRLSRDPRNDRGR